MHAAGGRKSVQVESDIWGNYWEKFERMGIDLYLTRGNKYTINSPESDLLAHDIVK